MKKSIIFLVLLCCAFYCSLFAAKSKNCFILCYASENFVSSYAVSDSSSEQENGAIEAADELLNSLDFSELEKIYEKYFCNWAPSYDSFKDLLKKIIMGESTYQITQIKDYFFTSLLQNGKSFIPVFAEIALIGIIFGLFNCLQPEKSRTSDMLFACCYVVTATALFMQTAAIIKNSVQIINEAVKALQNLFPIAVTLSAFCGESARSAIISPVGSFVLQGVSLAVYNLLLPALSIIFVLSALSALSERFGICKIRDFFCEAFKWIIGLAASVISLFSTVTVASAAARDGVSLRALKYTVGNTIPFVGGLAKEGVDLLFAASSLVKSALGSFMLVTILCMIIAPLLKIAAYSLSLKLLSAIMRNFADKRIVDLTDNFSKTVNYLVALIVFSFVIFFFVLYITFFAFLYGG